MRSLCLLLVALASGAAEPSAPAKAPRPPNIVLIVSDDQAWTDFGFMGSKVVATPNLDRLAAESRCFPRGYVVNSLCGPSLASLLTGRHPHEHGVTGNDPPWPAGMEKDPKRYQSPVFQAGRAEFTRLWERHPHMPALFTQQGYVALQTGKWWLGDFSHGGFTEGMTQGGRHGDAGLDIGRKTLDPIPDFVARAHRDGKPFFLWYAPMMPHDPHTPPARLLAKYRDKTPSLHQARYWAMCEWFDETVGGVRAILEKEGVVQDTIIVFLVDNGWIQNQDNPRFDPRSKQSPFDGGVRTPILVSWPGRIAPGRVDTPVSEVDILPTLLRLAGQPTPPGLPGLDLSDQAAVAARPAVFGSNSTHDIVEVGAPAKSLRYRWVVAGDWKMVVSSGLHDATEPPRLFDLKADPEERHDLAAERSEEVKRLTALLDGWWDGR